MKAVLLALALLGVGLGGSAATPKFFARRDYPDLAYYVQVADTNGDGIPDIIAGGSNDITVLLGNGNGTFTLGPISPFGITSSQFIPVDLNGDGVIDLVVSGQFNNQQVSGIGVCFGNGDGTFQPAVPYDVATTSASVSGLVLGDFNGDGLPDAAVAGQILPAGPGGIWLFPGEGAGVFGAPTFISCYFPADDSWVDDYR
jgi:hypothetical protein